MTPSEIKEYTKKQLDSSIEIAKTFDTGLESFSKRFFDFRIALTGFLGVILTIIFSNREDFSFYLPVAVVIVFIFSVVLLLYELFKEGGRRMQDLNQSERTLILHNILYSAVQGNLTNYIADASMALTKEHKIGQAMKNGKTVEEIISLISYNRKWDLNLILWSLLTLSVPVIFLLELLSKTYC